MGGFFLPTSATNKQGFSIKYDIKENGNSRIWGCLPHKMHQDIFLKEMYLAYIFLLFTVIICTFLLNLFNIFSMWGPNNPSCHGPLTCMETPLFKTPNYKEIYRRRRLLIERDFCANFNPIETRRLRKMIHKKAIR